MIDKFIIFNKHGVVLWSKSLGANVHSEPVTRLIHDVLLEEKKGETVFEYENYALKWTFANELDLVFVVVYQKLLQLLYLDDLLEAVKQAFVQQFRDVIVAATKPVTFDAAFDDILFTVEQSKLRRKLHHQRSFAESRGGRRSAAHDKGASDDERDASRTEESDGAANDEDGPGDSTAGSADDGHVPDAELAKARQRLAEKGRGQRAGRRSESKRGGASKKPAKPGKKPRKWGDSKLSTEEMKELDRSAAPAHSGGAAAAAAEEFGSALDMGASLADRPEDEAWAIGDADEEEGAPAAAAAAPTRSASKAPAARGWGLGAVGGLLQQLSGNKVLEREDLAPVLEPVKQNLIAKNVASEIADELCESLCQSLVGQRLGSFTRVSTVVQQALEDAVTRILTPKRSVDVLRMAMAAKDAGRPFTITFVGVNGVGKSTSLSKVCYYLLQKRLSVLIAACDTFRSGAVEQLQVHAHRLGVEVYSQGYAKDPAAVARAAISEAKRRGIDCVLIDTAGRMQNNEPLMRALATLVAANEPDLVLFVGEALVGNDGVNQLVEFNRAMADQSELRHPRVVDGIVLTKFDTIDDKVGAALSMVYKTGQPIVFVGTGQKYTHLRRLNVHTVIQALFS